MKKKGENNMKKLFSVVVALSMLTTAGLIATVAAPNTTMNVSAAAQPPVQNTTAPRMAFELNASDDKDPYLDYNNNGVRLYGEDNAIYPTQSYTGADDFIYPNYVDPFDPGVISKDSITFNPAYIDMEYWEHYPPNDPGNWTNKTIRANGGDASEKVFLRMFYEPGYWHPVDSLMDQYSDSTLEDLEKFDAIVVETTYMITDANRNPIAGAPPGDQTHFVLPFTTNDWTRPGMNLAGVLDLAYADGKGTTQLTDGTIEVERRFEDVKIGTELNFMDHNLTLMDISADGTLKAKVKYVGNMYEEHSAERTHYDIEKGVKYYFSRANDKTTTTDPAYRWYMKVDWTYIDPDDPAQNRADIVLGRRLAAGETFYFNGVRYDMPAIYVTNDNPDKFKYITLQTPLPKCPYSSPIWYTGDVTENWDDWTHVTSQWLANVPKYNQIWLLPPFIDDWNWTMVDDIGLLKNNTLWDQDGIDVEIPEKGLIIDKLMMSLENEVYWYDETSYEPFNTTLAERLYSNGGEEWDWWNVYTQPINYTLIRLPDLEEEGDLYKASDVPQWYADFLNSRHGSLKVDGAEYLITTSYIAPNCNTDERHNQSKSDWTIHDII